jgi:hypothetical protein
MDAPYAPEAPKPSGVADLLATSTVRPESRTACWSSLPPTESGTSGLGQMPSHRRRRTIALDVQGVGELSGWSQRFGGG